MAKVIPVFKGIVRNRVFYPDESALFEMWMDGLEGVVSDLSIRSHKEKRTDQQNKYYWAVVVRMIREALDLHEDEEAHSVLATMFLKKIIEVKGKRHVVVRSTTSLTTEEFAEYVDRCKQWASLELGVFIPDATKVEVR